MGVMPATQSRLCSREEIDAALNGEWMELPEPAADAN